MAQPQQPTHHTLAEQRAEAQAYIDREFTHSGTLDPEDLFKPTTVLNADLNGGKSGFFLKLILRENIYINTKKKISLKLKFP